MLEPRLFAALAAGALVVTPNRRLARGIGAAWDAQQRDAGRRAWRAARVLPWSAWLEALWHDAVAEDTLQSPRVRVRESAARLRWERIVAADGTVPFDPRGAAVLAAEAWSLLHGFGEGDASTGPWRRDGDDDYAAFGRWAAHYRAQLADAAAVDEATLADVLAGAAGRVASWRRLDVLLAGFLDLSPQQRRLIAALAGSGARIAQTPSLAQRDARPLRTSAASPREELRQALTWARARALARPGAVVGIAVEDLATKRDEVRSLAEDVLCPGLARPGADGAPRPYNLSLGVALAETALVAAALDLIELGAAPAATARVAALARSPYLAGASTNWSRRAALEAQWLENGTRDVGTEGLARALETLDPALADRMRRAAREYRFPPHATPRAWVDCWRRWLAAVGWPGDRPLDSGEQQARTAFDELLAEFAALATVADRLSRIEAAGLVHGLARERVFQPESAPAPVQIVGVLEAAGLPFDALWVAGLAADRWPAAPEPNPLLPLAWQRARNVPRSSAAQSLAFARAVTRALAHAGPEVVMSHARAADDHARAPSQLVLEFAVEMDGAASPAAPDYATAMFERRPSHEAIADRVAPPVERGRPVRGGAGIVDAQSACPFKAVGVHRLGAEPWPRAAVGLSPGERGRLAHAVLAAFWRDVRDQATLLQLAGTDLDLRIDAAVAAARRALPDARWRALAPLVADGEAARLGTLLRAWLDVERARPPFVVVATEESGAVALADLAFDVRIDRVDALADGVAVIDYKTGNVPSPPSWLATPPPAPQLGMYLIAQCRTVRPGSPVRALAYAQLKPGQLRITGVVADEAVWPGMAPASRLTHGGGWAAFDAWWRTALADLARDIGAGAAPVAPRDGDRTCRACHLAPLCRIRATALPRDGEGDGDE